MHNAAMCTLSLYDVIGITRHLNIKLKSFSNIAQPLHKEAVRRFSFSFIAAQKSVIMSEAFFVDVSILSCQPGVTVTLRFVFKVIRDLESIDHMCINPILRIG